MNEITYIHTSSGTVFNLRTISQTELIEFFVAESRTHVDRDVQRENAMYLNPADNTFCLTNLSALFHGEELAAFCIIPQYNPSILMRVYTAAKYRRMGLASFLIKHFNITDLSCLKENTGALLMYEKLGFKQCKEHVWLIELSRTLS